MDTSDLEVDITSDHSKAIIEGKTAVPFKTLVALILQRKVTKLFADWGADKVIINSDLLTQLASAPQDSQENKTHVILITWAAGILCGVFALAVVQAVLLIGNIQLQFKELSIIAISLLGIAVLLSMLSKIKRKNRGEQIAESMERIASLLKK